MYRLEMAIKGKDRAKSIKSDIRGLQNTHKRKEIELESALSDG
jgi:hypothetical protein